MKNELGHDIPEDAVRIASTMGCVGEARYIYIDKEYDDGFPVASVGVDRPRRFRSTNFEKHKQEVCVVDGIGYVVFRSPSASPRSPIEPIPANQIPELPKARVNEETSTYDDAPLNFIVEDGFVIQSWQSLIKAFCVQLLKIDDGNNYTRHHFELRIAYYMVAHKGNRRGTWQFGQFAPMMTPGEYLKIHEGIMERSWLTKLATPL
jgi:hypothetical protein